MDTKTLSHVMVFRFCRDFEINGYGSVIRLSAKKCVCSNNLLDEIRYVLINHVYAYSMSPLKKQLLRSECKCVNEYNYSLQYEMGNNLPSLHSLSFIWKITFFE